MSSGKKRSKVLDKILKKPGAFNKSGGEGGAGDTHKTAMPVANGLAAIRGANQQQAYSPAYSQDLVADLTRQVEAALGMDQGMTPSPFGSSFPDLQRDSREPPDRKKIMTNPNQRPETKQVAPNVKEVVLDANYSNAFFANGKINGVDVQFLLDTGATQVSIPQRVADYIGLKPRGGAIEVRTASGLVPMFEVELDTLTIGEIELRFVKALINSSDRTETILLGMSALRKLEFTHKDDKLILRQEVK